MEKVLLQVTEHGILNKAHANKNNIPDSVIEDSYICILKKKISSFIFKFPFILNFLGVRWWNLMP